MHSRLELEILPQPDDVTCGPTCLHAVYRYYGDDVAIADVVASVPQLEGGGTLAVNLGRDALARGYTATILTFNLQVFDPTWFRPGVDLAERLRAQARAKPSTRLRGATRAYLDFLENGGEVVARDLDPALLRSYLEREIPILTGLSATQLYRCARERPSEDETHRLVADDVGGEPQGHFVVLLGYDSAARRVLVADPLRPNPAFAGHPYEVPIDRLVSAVFLGILTYDANLLVIEPKEGSRG